MSGEASHGPKIILQGIVGIGILAMTITLIGNLLVFTLIMGTHIESMILQQTPISMLVNRRVVKANNYLDLNRIEGLQTRHRGRDYCFLKCQQDQTGASRRIDVKKRRDTA